MVLGKRERRTNRQRAARARSSRPSARGRPRPEPSSARSTRPLVAGVGISHPDRVVYPKERITKLDVAQYYERISEWMLPHVSGRPLTLVRCPEGITGCFYMKHSKVWAPSGLRRVQIQEKTKVGEYLVAESPEALVGLAQMGILEIHTWNSHVDRLEQPDRIVIDIDPGAQATWAQVIAAAHLVKELLEAADLESFLKTTGGRGLHVVVPLTPSADWETCLAFARGLATEMERQDPKQFTTAYSKTGREQKLLIDYLRNNRTNTSIAAYSTRARPGAPVSVPLRWTELKPSLDPASLTMRTVEGRLRRQRADPWSGYWRIRQTLPKSPPWPPD